MSPEIEEFRRLYGGTSAPMEMIEAFVSGIRVGRLMQPEPPKIMDVWMRKNGYDQELRIVEVVNKSKGLSIQVSE